MSDWIKCSESLPELYRPVLIWVKESVFDIARPILAALYSNDHNKTFKNLDNDNYPDEDSLSSEYKAGYEATHWMPIEPPND